MNGNETNGQDRGRKVGAEGIAAGGGASGPTRSASGPRGGGAMGPGRRAAVLLVSPDPLMTQAVRQGLREEVAPWLVLRVVEDATAAVAAMLEEGPRLVLVDAALPRTSIEAIGAAGRDAREGAGSPGSAVVLLDPTPTLDRTLFAMRSGLVDVIDPSASADRAAAARATGVGPRGLLGEVTRVLSEAEQWGGPGGRHQAASGPALSVAFPGREDEDTAGRTASELLAIADDLARAYAGLGRQAGTIALSSELNGLLRQELEVESLLRTLLEFLLARVGPTNAGVFLPTSDGDFSLGAYINYDVPKESAETLLEQLTAGIAPRFERESAVLLAEDESAVQAAFGEHAAWFDGRAVLAVGCHGPSGEAEANAEPGCPASGGAGGGMDDPDAEEPECLAVLCLFRDRSVSFSPEATEVVQVAADLFGKQLSRVVRVHNRVGALDDGLDEI